MRSRVVVYLCAVLACTLAFLYLVVPVTEHPVGCTLDMTYFERGKPVAAVGCGGVLWDAHVILSEPIEVGTEVECVRAARYLPGTYIKVPFTPSRMKDCRPKAT